MGWVGVGCHITTGEHVWAACCHSSWTAKGRWLGCCQDYIPSRLCIWSFTRTQKMRTVAFMQFARLQFSPIYIPWANDSIIGLSHDLISHHEKVRSKKEPSPSIKMDIRVRVMESPNWEIWTGLTARAHNLSDGDIIKPIQRPICLYDCNTQFWAIHMDGCNRWVIGGYVNGHDLAYSVINFFQCSPLCKLGRLARGRVQPEVGGQCGDRSVEIDVLRR